MTLDPNNTRSNKEVIMNIQHLKYAVEIAKYGSISKASEALYVAQPNLSRAIKDLEKELGIVIFDRFILFYLKSCINTYRESSVKRITS